MHYEARVFFRLTGFSRVLRDGLYFICQGLCRKVSDHLGSGTSYKIEVTCCQVTWLMLSVGKLEEKLIFFNYAINVTLMEGSS